MDTRQTVNAVHEVKGIRQPDNPKKGYNRTENTEIETAATLGQLDTEAANKQVLQVALAHQIVSSQTSLIAVDKTPRRPADAPLTKKDIPLNLPAGWSFEKVFGKDAPAPKAKDTRDASLQAFTQLAMVEKPVTTANGLQQQVNLPQTATPAGVLGLIGLLLALLAATFRVLALRLKWLGV